MTTSGSQELFCLHLDSSKDIKQDGVTTPDSSWLSVEFPNQLNLDTGKHYTCAMHKGVIPNSWMTVGPSLENDVFTLGSTPYSVNAGHHSIRTLQDTINRQIGATSNADGIVLEPLYYNGRIIVHNNTTELLTFGLLGKVLGFGSGEQVQPNGGSLKGASKAVFNGGVDQIKIECNLVDPKYARNGTRGSRILYTITPFNTQDKAPYAFINSTETFPHYVQMTNESSIQRVEIRLLDQDNRQVYLDNMYTEFCVCIRVLPGNPPELVPTRQI